MQGQVSGVLVEHRQAAVHMHASVCRPRGFAGPQSSNASPANCADVQSKLPHIPHRRPMYVIPAKSLTSRVYGCCWGLPKCGS